SASSTAMSATSRRCRVSSALIHHFGVEVAPSADEQNANEHTMPETAEIYDELIRCKTPPELVRGYFLVSMLCERIDEEQRGERLR
ncbi:MAG: hypothetical protein WA778_09555, partial [Pseudolabrys sp.]